MLAGTFSGRGLPRARGNGGAASPWRWAVGGARGGRGGLLVTALLKADVVIGADAGEHRDFLAAQARSPPVAPRVWKLDVLGPNELPPGAEVLADWILARHDTTIRPLDTAILALPLPGSA